MSGSTPDSRSRSITGRIGDALRLLRLSLSGESHDFTTGPLGRAIVLLAVPMMLEMVMESVFAVVDIFFVARLGKEAVATVGLTESMMTLLYAVAIGLAMSTTAMVARRVGEKDLAGASNAAMQAIWLGLGVAVVVGIPGFVYGGRLLAWMGASPEVVAGGSTYTRILLGTNGVILLLFIHNAIFRGAGDATIAMRSLWLANGINIVLDPCLIFGIGPFPELGVTGAAVATTIGRGTGVVYQLLAFRSAASRIHLHGEARKLRPDVLVRLVRVSLGGIGQFLIATASWVVLMRIVAPYGSAALAGYTIAVRVVIFALLPSWGLANAGATLVGQSLGARKPERAERAIWLTGAYNMIFLAIVTIAFVGLAPWLVGIFTDDAEILPFSVDSLRIISYGYVFYAWGMVLTQAFNGAGDTRTPTRINAVSFWLLQIPLAWSLASWAGWGPHGVFWSVAVSEAFLALVAAWAFRRGAWKKVEI